jgi:hypothetical protein
MPRKTNLDVSVFNIDGTSVLGTAKNATLEISQTTEGVRGINLRHQKDCVVKRTWKLSGSFRKFNGTACRTSLDVSVFSIGGTDYLGDLDSLEISITTEDKIAEGVADEWVSLQAVGTRHEISGKLKIAGSATSTLMALAAGTIASLDVTVAVTIGGVLTATMPMMLQMASHQLAEADLQMIDVKFSPRGAPTGTPTGDSLFISAFTGTSVAAIAASTGAQTYAGSSLISSARISAQNGQIISLDYEFKGLGALSVS